MLEINLKTNSLTLSQWQIRMQKYKFILGLKTFRLITEGQIFLSTLRNKIKSHNISKNYYLGY